jgi:hypothetical protein
MSKQASKGSTLEALRDVLSNRGYALHLSTKRNGDTLTATLSVVDLKNERSLLKLVASARMEDIDVTFGLNLAEESLWEGMRSLVDLLGSLRQVVPFEITVSG